MPLNINTLGPGIGSGSNGGGFSIENNGSCILSTVTGIKYMSLSSGNLAPRTGSINNLLL